MFLFVVCCKMERKDTEGKGVGGLDGIEWIEMNPGFLRVHFMYLHLVKCISQGSKSKPTTKVETLQQGVAGCFRWLPQVVSIRIEKTIWAYLGYRHFCSVNRQHTEVWARIVSQKSVNVWLSFESLSLLGRICWTWPTCNDVPLGTTPLAKGCTNTQRRGVSVSNALVAIFASESHRENTWDHVLSMQRTRSQSNPLVRVGRRTSIAFLSFFPPKQGEGCSFHCVPSWSILDSLVALSVSMPRWPENGWLDSKPIICKQFFFELAVSNYNLAVLSPWRGVPTMKRYEKG